jgi:hypothetical protein
LDCLTVFLIIETLSRASRPGAATSQVCDSVSGGGDSQLSGIQVGDPAIDVAGDLPLASGEGGQTSTVSAIQTTEHGSRYLLTRPAIPLPPTTIALGVFDHRLGVGESCTMRVSTSSVPGNTPL